MNKYEIVDFLRGYSIFTIVLMHLLMGHMTGVYFKAILFGGAGVHVFILCSGFGLYLSYLKKPLSYGDFLRRRFDKIWVPYAIAVLLWGVWFLVSKGYFPVREVASHLLLYKMFSVELDTSLCYPYWFISTIVQFYLFWPLIVKVYRMRWGGAGLFIISLLWSTIVGLLGLEEERPWGSFFLQYIWEFALGMWIAERCLKPDGKATGSCWGKRTSSSGRALLGNGGEKLMDIQAYKWWWLIAGAISGMGLSAMMAWNGGVLKLYNDIPSLIGYLSVALLVYKVGVKVVNRSFEWTNSFSYELYLVHSLVFVVVGYLLTTSISSFPISALLIIKFVIACIVAYIFKWFLIYSKLVK